MPLRLAEHLVTRGLIAAATVEEAQRRRASYGGGLDTALLELDALSESALLSACAEVCGLRAVNLADFEPNREMSRFVPANVAERLAAVPLSEDRGVLHMACAYPPPVRDLEEVSLLLGRKLELWVALEVRVRDWISAVYRSPLPPRFAVLLARLDPSRASPPRPSESPAVGRPRPPHDELSLEEALTREVGMRRPLAQDPVIPLERPKRAVPEATVSFDLNALAKPTAPAPVNTLSSAPTAPNANEALATAPTEDFEEPPQVVVFPTPGLSEPPPQGALPSPKIAQLEAAPEPIPTDLPPSPERAPEWSLDDARGALGHAADRDQIIWVALQLARRTFEFSAAFAVVRGNAVGWAAEGPGAEGFKASPPAIPLDAPSLFRTVAVTRGSYLGPPPADPNTAQFLAQLGRAPRTVFLFPIEVNGRVVCLLYADPGARAVSQRRMAEVVLLCQELPSAFAKVILHRKHQHAARMPGAVADMARAAAAAMGWSPGAQRGFVTHGRAASLPAPVVDLSARPPTDFGPVLRRLTGPDATARAAAVAELARTPEASARVLVAQFPGPTAWARLPVTDLPDPEELGPVPAALSRLGRAGAVSLAPLLDSADLEVRYFALLTAGSLPFAELVGGVLRGLFDADPDIASAARAAAGALRRVPRFASSMRDLRQELASPDTLRRSLAARAVGVLHDRDAVEALINLTGSDDGMCADAAAEALGELTGQAFGADQHAWTRWWAEHRTRSRAEWLVTALRHQDAGVRTRAFEELSRVLNDALGYDPEASATEREAALRRWEAAAVTDPRMRRLE